MSAVGANVRPRPFELLHYTSIAPTLDAGDFVEGLLTRNAISIIYGPSNSGKTFFATDLGLHVGAGLRWRDREVDQGAVLYVALEGGHGIANRVYAFRRERRIEAAAFAVLNQALNLRSSIENVLTVISAAQELEALSGYPIRLIVIDTLARALAGGDENSSTDMGSLLSACDKIREATKANVLLIHHTGKDVKRGERGWSGLRAAADTSIAIERLEDSGISVATVEKQRDLPKGDRVAFRLQQVDLGKNNRGKLVTSCIVDPVDVAPPAKGKGKRGDGLTPTERTALDALTVAVDEIGEKPPASNHIPPSVRIVPMGKWREYAKRRGVSSAEKEDDQRRTCDRAINSVIGKKYAGCWNESVWLVSNSD